MQSWAKRGLQTALVTGGLLMLGTGIASAAENVNPDKPATPLDLNVSVPVDVKDNALGTPLGQLNVPGYHGTVSTKPVTDVAKKAMAPLRKAGATAGVEKVSGSLPTGQITGAASKVTDLAKSASRQAKADKVTAPSLNVTDNALKGNKISGDLVVPLQATGNAVGAGGDAVVENSSSSQTWSHDSDVATEGKNSAAAGNAVVLDWALPVQLSGNAVGGLGGSGRTKGSASQSTTETGDVTTTGQGSGVSGNVVGGQFATPIQITGNAVSGLVGNAYSEYDSSSQAKSGGSIKTNGEGGAGTGNVGAVPLALPTKVNGNAAGGLGGDSDAASTSVTDAKAGDVRPGGAGTPTFAQTQGDNSFLAGNIAQPQGSFVGTVAGNAASGLGGNTTTGNALGGRSATGDSATESTAEAGGVTSTSGRNSAGSGNVADAPFAVPAEVFAIGAGGIGNAHADHANDTTATSGGRTFSDGTGSFLSGNTAHAQPAVTGETFGLGGAGIGNASGTGTETKAVKAGGYNGTKGDNSSGSGNLVQVPAAVPAEVLGIGAGGIGQGDGTADEVKTLEAGGGGNTEDDNGAASSNLVAAPIATPAQVFGIGGGAAGQGHGKASTDTTATSGGKYHATGPVGAVAGNIAQAPVALPAQVHGIGGALGGIGSGESDNLTDATAGDDASTDGTAGAVAGNIAQAPVGSVASVFGTGAALGGLGTGTGVNDVTSHAGGDSATKGDGGSVAGNIVGGQALPVASVFGNGATLGGLGNGAGTNVVDAASGGDTTTSGVSGALSGDILDVPAAAVAQPFGVAAAGAGAANGLADNTTAGEVGGTSTTTGAQNGLSGVDGQLPVGALAQVYDVPVQLVGTANSDTTNLTSVVEGDQQPTINLPITGSALGVDKLPTLPAVPAVPSLPGVPGALPKSGLPTVPVMPRTLPRAETPFTGVLPTSGVPGLDIVESVLNTISGNGLPGVDVAQSVLSTVSGSGLPTEGVLSGDLLSGLPALPGTDVAHTLPAPVERADTPVSGVLPVDTHSVNVLPLQGGSLLPTGLLSGGLLPTNVLPTNILPTNVLPTNVLPTNVLPTNVVPAKVLPAKVVPTTALPTMGAAGERGDLPTLPINVLPTNVVPTAAVPAGVLPAAEVPSVTDTKAGPLGTVVRAVKSLFGKQMHNM